MRSDAGNINTASTTNLSTMKLTANTIHNAPNVVNPEGKLTLNLRNLQITYIENLELTQDAFSVFDFTNNEIVELSGLPPFKNLETLLLANNSISTIVLAPESLKSISLTNNNISRFGHILPLRHVLLTSLVLLGNPIALDKSFRLFVVWLIPSLRVLDFVKVKESERVQAKEVFGNSFDEATPAALALIEGGDAPKVEKDTRLMKTTVKKLTKEQKEKLVGDLEKAESMEEIEKIQKALKDGYVE